MDERRLDLLECLNYIDPALLEYQDWVNVGMALQHEGYTAATWDEWSRKDSARYKAGECFKKWLGFRGAPIPVTGATIVALAKDHGWRPKRKEHDHVDHALEWDAEIGADYQVVDVEWVEGKDIVMPAHWHPSTDLITYLQTLFDSNENVGYVTESYQTEDGKYLPTKGSWARTAGELIQELTKYGDDIGAVLGDYKEAAGAWIRFNPLDGTGCKNDNVTEYRFALVESDNMPLDKQNALIREMELPVACLVYSGKKSIHAIVRIEASSYEEYRKRVDYLYNVCQKNGMKIDTQNRNPSRLSRMPGVTREGNKQFLIDTNIGKASWAEWYEWIEGVNDDLPEPESLADVYNNLPPLSPSLIDGVLRQGHKMLLAGPSKAGKSYALIELCIAIAEGSKWLQWACTKGRVMYVNLELDRASCLHRFRDVYQGLGLPPKNIGNIDIWNLRGKSVPMDKLAPKLIRRAQKKDYIAVVIDPIYKVITGDENSADQMAHFTNQFDKVCTELGSAVIYCHHHSKGYQGSKRSMDRASGSGVFARDPDALLDLTELELNNDIKKQQEDAAQAAYMVQRLKDLPGYSVVGQDDELSRAQMLMHAEALLSTEDLQSLENDLESVKAKVSHQTAWRIEGTLREFASFKPVDLWFKYPTHEVDDIGVLSALKPESDKPSWQRAQEKRSSKEENKEKRMIEVENAMEALSINEQITFKDLSEYMGVSEKTVKRRIDEHGGFEAVDVEGQMNKIVVPKET